MSSGEVVTPLDVEREILELNSHIDAAPKIVKEHHERLRRARRNYKMAWAMAYRLADGTQQDKKCEADLETRQDLSDLDVAEVEYRYVSDLLDAYKTKLRALQSVSSIMKAQMFAPQGGL